MKRTVLDSGPKKTMALPQNLWVISFDNTGERLRKMGDQVGLGAISVLGTQYARVSGISEIAQSPSPAFLLPGEKGERRYSLDSIWIPY